MRGPDGWCARDPVSVPRLRLDEVEVSIAIVVQDAGC